MLKNYFKTAFRNLWRNKSATFINVLGLTIGLCCCMLIGLYIRHELSYDDFEQKGDRIARVIMGYKFDGGNEFKRGNYTSVKVAPVFKRTFPEVSDAVRMTMLQMIVQYNDKLINEKKFAFADPSFFNMFSFKLLKGDAATALSAKNRVVLTETTAKRYFGSEDPIGKTLKVGSDTSLYQVTGVMEDCPSNSQIKFDFLGSFASLGTESQEKTYWDANYTTYLLLKSSEALPSLQAKIAPFMKKEMAGQGATIEYTLEPFTRVHLYSEYDGFEPNNSITYVYILEAVAFMILVIACFTYVNLNTARSMERAKEVGVRKVIGAGNGQLFWQFIGESVLMCTIATVFSLIIAAIILPLFNQLTEKQLSAASLFSPLFIGAAIFIIVLVSLLAGSYPALVLSNFQPVKVLKGSFKNTGSGQWVRKALIVFQFSISVVLIVSTFIIQNQLSYIRNKKLGYNRDHVLVLPMDRRMAGQIAAIKQELKANTNVLSVSRCYSTPVSIGGGYNMRSAAMPESQQINVTANPIDEDYINTTGLQLVAGDNLTQQDIKDVSVEGKDPANYHFILNESAARQLGWTAQQAVGKRMFLDASRPGYVRGVIKDFNFESMHTAIKPLVLFPENRGSKLLVKLSGNNLTETLAFLQSEWKRLVPYRPFEYYFLDEDFNRLYSSEMRLGTVLNIFAAIAIALACLGLLGLSSYSAKQRIKEIGIRKVLGASVTNIVTVLSINFVQLVVAAILLSTPIAWYLMDKWLQGFAYRITISWWIFLLSGVVALSIAVITVSFQAIKAALMNPVKNLRTE